MKTLYFSLFFYFFACIGFFSVHAQEVPLKSIAVKSQLAEDIEQIKNPQNLYPDSINFDITQKQLEQLEKNQNLIELHQLPELISVLRNAADAYINYIVSHRPKFLEIFPKKIWMTSLVAQSAIWGLVNTMGPSKEGNITQGTLLAANFITLPLGFWAYLKVKDKKKLENLTRALDKAKQDLKLCLDQYI